MTNEINLSDVEIKKISLKPGDVLAIKVRGDDIPEEELKRFSNNVQKFVPNNKVIAFSVPYDSDVQFEAISSEKNVVDCGPKACEDCSCGKKERLQALDELAQETENLGLTQGELK